MANEPTKWDLVEEAKGIAARAYDAGRKNGKTENLGIAGMKALTDIVDAVFTTDVRPGLRPDLSTLDGLRQLVETVRATVLNAARLRKDRDDAQILHGQAVRELSAAIERNKKIPALEEEVAKLRRELDMQYKRGYRAGVNRVAKEALKRDEEIAAENNETCPGGC